LFAHIVKAERAIQAYDRAIGLEVDPAVGRVFETRRGELLS
jgi:predicted RNA polymerase sigma factor